MVLYDGADAMLSVINGDGQLIGGRPPDLRDFRRAAPFDGVIVHPETAPGRT